MPDPSLRPSNALPSGSVPGLRRTRREGSAPAGARKLTAPFPAGPLGVVADLPDPQILPAALDLLNRVHGGLGCVVFRVEPGFLLSGHGTGEGGDSGEVLQPELAQPGPDSEERLLHAAPELLLRACEPVARESAEAREPLVAESRLAGSRCLVMAVPLFEGDRLAAVLCRAHEPQHRGEAAALAAMQGAGLLRLLAATRSESLRVRTRFDRVAALIELTGASSGGVDFAECARRLAHHLRDTVGCETVALSLRDWRGHRLVAVTGESAPAEAHSPGRRALLSHLGEAVQQRRTLHCRRERSSSANAAPAAPALREWFDPAVSLCLPLVEVGGKVRGAWLFLWKAEPEDFAEKQALIEAATPEVANLLDLLHRAKPGAAAGAVLRLWKRGSLTARRIWTGLAAAALAGALVPLPYPVRATCELQPVVRRVIAAPFDGILLRSAVRSGEVVQKGRLLAEMDGREIRSQLSEATASRERAAREADQLLAEGRIAESRIAALEAEGLAHEIELLEYRRGHLEVRSPIDGIVLQGDLERSEGAPLRIGDPLFEVGPLDRLVAEIAVEAADLSLVREGAEVSLKLESDANASPRSAILRIAPKSEWREDGNVFLCEAELANPDGEWRPGIKGKARIAGPRRPLLWIGLRDAWLALRYRLW